MAQNFRNDLQSAVGTGAVTLVTGANYDAVIGIRLCNILTSTIKLMFTLSIVEINILQKVLLFHQILQSN